MRAPVSILTLALLLGCAEDPPDATPEGALAEFVKAMEESRYDDARRADAYALLDSGSQAELGDRVGRAEALGRSGLEPWEMIAIGRFRLELEPRRMEARVEGDRGVVVVHGTRGERAEVPVVREGESWRVVLFPADEPSAAPSEEE